MEGKHFFPLLILSSLAGALQIRMTKKKEERNRSTRDFPGGRVVKEMATHSSVLAWRIPGMGEPGGLPSMGSHRVRHD